MRVIRRNGSVYTNHNNTYIYENKKIITAKKNLSDFSFIFPIRLESSDRINVLSMTLSYIKKHFNTNILICEDGPVSVLPSQLNLDGISYIFQLNTDIHFHKTKCLNSLMNYAQTNFIISNDSDCIFKIDQYIEAANSLRNNVYDFAYPFDQPTHNVPVTVHHRFLTDPSISVIEGDSTVKNDGIAPGGCFFITKDIFKAAGYENENFLSWGPEDQERRDRLKILGYRVGSIPGKLFHFDHSRTHNSNQTNNYFRANEQEYDKIKNMPRNELEAYISSWQWGK